MDTEARVKRKKAIRGRLIGTGKRPRLNVFRSNKHIYAALINDEDGKTLVLVNDKFLQEGKNNTKSERAYLVGKRLAEKANKEGYKEVVFDRAGYLFHGRVKKLAEGAREGLKF